MTPEERFWRRVDKSGDHWLWTATPRLTSGTWHLGTRRQIPVLRKAWELTRGPIPPGASVYAACGTPRCVRHLAIGTNADISRLNWQLGKAEGFPLGESHPCHRLTEAEVLSAWHSEKPAAAVAAQLGVSRQSIDNIRTGRTWAWLTGSSRGAA